jgi:hypothetical protein
MPQIIPTGQDISVIPQAPNFGDPRLLAADPERNQRALEAGVAFSQVMLDLKNKQASRELDSVKIKAAKAQNDLDLALSQHALDNSQVLKDHVDAALAAQRVTDSTNFNTATGLNNASVAAPVVGQYAAGTGVNNALAAYNASTTAPDAATLAAQATLAKAKADSIAANAGIGIAGANATYAGNTPAAVTEAKNQNLNAIAAAYGGYGINPFTSNQAPSDAPAAPSNILNQTAVVPGTPVDYLGHPLKGPSQNSTAGSVPAMLFHTATGQYVKGSTGNLIMDASISKMAIPTYLAQSAKMQDEARSVLDKYVTPDNLRQQMMDGDNHYDVNKVRQYVDAVKDLNPKTTYGYLPGYSTAFDKCGLIKQTQALGDKLPELMKSFGNPGVMARTLANIAPAGGGDSQGLFTSTLTNALKSLAPDGAAAQNALVKFVNSRIQEINNTSNEGRTTKNLSMLDPAWSPEKIAYVYKTVTAPALEAELALTKQGYPPTSFSSLDHTSGEALTPGAIAGEHAAAVDKLGPNPMRAPTTAPAAPAAPKQWKEGDEAYIKGAPYIYVKWNGASYWRPKK